MAGKRRKFYERIIFYLGHSLLESRTLDLIDEWGSVIEHVLK